MEVLLAAEGGIEGGVVHDVVAMALPRRARKTGEM
jgi:hypothetical protein